MRGTGDIEREFGRDKLITSPFAANQLEILGSEESGEGHKAGLRPLTVQEVVVAAGAFHAGGHKYLGNVCRALDRFGVVVIQDVADLQDGAIGVARGKFGVTGHPRVDEFGDHQVERAVGGEIPEESSHDDCRGWEFPR